MKHYLDIENLRDTDIILNDEITRPRNDQGFNKGDRVLVTEKFDGSCASCSWDGFENRLRCFSHKQELSFDKTLNGFWNFCQNLDLNIFKDNEEYIFFGEWSGARNKIVYNQDARGKWYIFDIYNKATERWLPQNKTIQFCEEHNLTHVNILYQGNFLGWVHIKSFMNMPNYGETQEGVVVSNLTQQDAEYIGNDDFRVAFKLKLVNNKFKESKIRVPKEINPEVEEAKKKAQEMLEQIVTESRVEKIIIKLQQEEDVLPRQLSASDMGLIARTLPREVYNDVLKEEKEVIVACGEYAGKICNSITMNIARKLILG